jgi:hypothetical protein
VVETLTAEAQEPEEQKMRKMAELRVLLEKRVNELQTELDQLESMLEFVNSTLLEKGFRKPEIKLPLTQPSITPEAAAPSKQAPKPPEEAPFFLEHAQAIPIKTVTGDLLAELYADDENMHVVLAKDKQFTADTPPFTAFLVQRVLAKMQEKDSESASQGEIPRERILSYEIMKDGDIIREINITNIGTDRTRELKSSIRWTLEKMYEKMKAAP